MVKIEDRIEKLEKEIADLKRKNKTKRVLVNVLLDESGSMQSCLDSTIEGFNSYVGSLLDAKDDMEYRLTVTKFDSRGNRVLWEAAPLKGIALNRDNYKPTGGTPLYDALGESISRVNAAKDESVFFVIITDGGENESKRYTRDSVRQMIEGKTESGWSFVYLGANQDAWNVGSSFGVNNSFNYTTKNMAQNFRSASAMTTMYAASASAGASSAERDAVIGATRTATYDDVLDEQKPVV